MSTDLTDDWSGPVTEGELAALEWLGHHWNDPINADKTVLRLVGEIKRLWRREQELVEWCQQAQLAITEDADNAPAFDEDFLEGKAAGYGAVVLHIQRDKDV